MLRLIGSFHPFRNAVARALTTVAVLTMLFGTTPETHPPCRTVCALIATAPQAVPSFEHTDAAFRSRRTTVGLVESWTAVVPRGNRNVEFVIDGTDEANPRLLASARTLLADFDTLERRVWDYLAREAQQPLEEPEMRAQVGTLHIRAVKLLSIDRPERAIMDFNGPDEIYWSCIWERGEFSDLDYDS